MMKQVSFGDTGVDVSALCLGCMYFGSRVDEETSRRLMDQYIAAGGSFLDTANNYAFWVDGYVGGESESTLGRWMKDRANRDEIFLATKVGAKPLFDGGGFENAEGLSTAAITRAAEESLKRLGTDHIDLYYAHIDDRSTSLEETLEAFDGLVGSGKVRYVACSNIPAWRIEEARNVSRINGFTEYRCVQQRRSYLRPKPGADFSPQVAASDELLDYCETRGDLPLLAYSPLLEGSYTREDRPIPENYSGPDTDARLEALGRVAREVGKTPNQVVLSWMMGQTPRTIPLISASTPAQLEENIGALEVELGSEHARLLVDASD